MKYCAKFYRTLFYKHPRKREEEWRRSNILTQSALKYSNYSEKNQAVDSTDTTNNKQDKYKESYT